MKKYLKNYLIIIMSVILLSACSTLSDEADKKIQELKSKTAALDSLINTEVDKVLALDSLINTESGKLKKLDSVITNSTSKIDSISAKGIELLEKFKK